MDPVVGLGDVMAIMQASGGIGIWVLAWFVWKFDRRLLKLELTSLNCPLRNPDKKREQGDWACGMSDVEQEMLDNETGAAGDGGERGEPGGGERPR